MGCYSLISKRTGSWIFHVSDNCTIALLFMTAFRQHSFDVCVAHRCHSSVFPEPSIYICPFVSHMDRGGNQCLYCQWTAFMLLLCHFCDLQQADQELGDKSEDLEMLMKCVCLCMLIFFWDDLFPPQLTKSNQCR